MIILLTGILLSISDSQWALIVSATSVLLGPAILIRIVTKLLVDENKRAILRFEVNQLQKDLEGAVKRIKELEDEVWKK